jgi:hypothetical protein
MPARKEFTWEVNSNGCHVCTSHPKDDRGYAKCKRNGRNYKVHRFVYEQHHGPIPEGLVIRHKCDNPSCINIEHLETGTVRDNVRDAVERGRHRHRPFENQAGEGNHQAIVTEDIVRKIRTSTAIPNTVLGRRYGIHHSTVSAIRLCKSWKHVV